MSPREPEVQRDHDAAEGLGPEAHGLDERGRRALVGALEEELLARVALGDQELDEGPEVEAPRLLHDPRLRTSRGPRRRGRSTPPESPALDEAVEIDLIELAQRLPGHGVALLPVLGERPDVLGEARAEAPRRPRGSSCAGRSARRSAARRPPPAPALRNSFFSTSASKARSLAQSSRKRGVTARSRWGRPPSAGGLAPPTALRRRTRRQAGPRRAAAPRRPARGGRRASSSGGRGRGPTRPRARGPRSSRPPGRWPARSPRAPRR